MKSFIFSLFLIAAFNFPANAQRKISVNISSGQPPFLAADAGANVASSGSAQLGGEPTASGGVPPYQYQWLPESGLDQANVSNPVWSGTAAATYSVSVTDERGCSAIDTVSVLVTGFSVPGDNDIDVYPNPATGMIRLSGNNLSVLAGATIHLINSSGQVVRSSQWNYGYQDQLFNVSGIAHGNYLITIESKHQLITKRLIIGNK